MKCLATIEGYRSYYASLEFQQDLLKWFDVSIPYKGTYPHVLFVAQQRHRCRIYSSYHRCSINREKSFYFSFIIFFLCLQAKVIRELSGDSMKDLYHTKTGVPLFSCGLGGEMHPTGTLREANLLPCSEERPSYIEMIDIIMPALREQVAELAEYADVDEMYKLIEQEVIAYRELLKTGDPKIMPFPYSWPKANGPRNSRGQSEFFKMHRLDEKATLSRPTDNIPNDTEIMVYAENDEQGIKTPHFHVSIDNGKIEFEVLFEHIDQLIIWRTKDNYPQTWNGFANVKARINEWLYEVRKNAFGLTNLRRMLLAWNDCNPTNEIDEEFCRK